MLVRDEQGDQQLFKFLAKFGTCGSGGQALEIRGFSKDFDTERVDLLALTWCWKSGSEDQGFKINDFSEDFEENSVGV